MFGFYAIKKESAMNILANFDNPVKSVEVKPVKKEENKLEFNMPYKKKKEDTQLIFGNSSKNFLM